MSTKILLIEDSKEIFQLVEHSLASPLMSLSWAKTIEEAKEKIEEADFSLILLDIELPDGNGLELCSQLQLQYPQLPIFILTAHDNLSEKVLGFSAGADDYITKPFNPLELKARVEAKIKKAEILKQSATKLNWSEIHINQTTQEVKIKSSGNELTPIELTALEFKILLYFAAKPYAVISRDDMLNDIWGEDVHVYSRSVDTHVSKLRKKLAEVSHIIESVHGTGYKFTPTE